MIEPYIYPEGEWMNKRAGSFTSSQIGSLFTEPRSKADKEAGNLSETAKSYIMQKVSELLTGTIRNSYQTPEMQWGLQQEPYAIELLKENYKDLVYYGAENPKFFQYSDLAEVHLMPYLTMLYLKSSVLILPRILNTFYAKVTSSQ